MVIGALYKKTKRWIRDQISARAVILMYHRIVQTEHDPRKLSVSPKHFAEHLEILQKYTRPTALQDLLLALQTNRIQPRMVVVTFDDGYANNLYQAKPLLERCDIPATVFVTTRGLELQGRFWQRALERLLLPPRTLPNKLHLSIEGTDHQWELEDASGGGEHIDSECSDGDNAAAKSCLTSRQSLYDSLCRLLAPLPATSRNQLLRELVMWAGMRGTDDDVSRPMTPDELIRLSDGNLVEIGAHTVTHPILSEISADLQRSELTHSKAQLEDILSRPVTNLAYPFGRRSDYTEQTVRLAQESGYMSACSAFPGVIHKRISLYELPRFAVHDWDGETFQRQLASWFQFSSLFMFLTA